MEQVAVRFLLGKLDALLGQEVTLLRGFRREVQFIADELQSMQAFLRDADAKKERNEGVKTWVKQVRDVAYDTEDVLDEFLIRLEQTSGQHGVIGFLQKTAQTIKNLKTRHKIASRIHAIRVRVEDISERSKRYDLINSGEQGSSSSFIYDPRMDALLLEEEELVGIHKPKEDLIGLLLEEAVKLGVVSVVGMGGLGKTTLVKKVFDDQRIKGNFHYHSWITVSQSFNIKHLLRDMLSQLFAEEKRSIPPELEEMDDVKLKNEVKKFLQDKRYVLVLDDIWSIDLLNYLKYALPDFKCNSRIIVTTRSKEIGASCANTKSHVYDLEPLSEDDSWKLFCMKAFQSIEDNFSCPSHLEEHSKTMLKKCEGLPLAIVTLGGLLSTKDKVETEWELVSRSLGAELQSSNHLGHVKRILNLSYIDLPFYLKSCFLYLSVFPENHFIERRRLLRLWIAEGFIEEKTGMTSEEVAEAYFDQLINRSLIHIIESDIDGNVRACRVHDLMREIILLKSKEECFGTMSVGNASNLLEKTRHLSIQNGETITRSTKFSHLRSLLMFRPVNTISSSSLSALLGSFRLLKVLDLRGAQLNKFPEVVINLIHLRYLSMRRTKIKTIPNSIKKLRNLETLDLKKTYVTKFPIGITELTKLRYLQAHHYEIESYVHLGDAKGFKAFMGIGKLVSLQKLNCIELDQASDDIVRDLAQLTQLRRLGILKLKAKDGIHLCSSIEKMSQLQSLYIASINETEVLELQSLTLPPLLLRRLYIEGHMENLPDWISQLRNLVRLRLRYLRLKDDNDPLEILQVLPNLVELELNQAYEGTSLCFKEGRFQKLKVLNLHELHQLRSITMEKGVLCCLQKLEIMKCNALENVPLGIEYLANLKELLFVDMKDDFINNLYPEDGGEGGDHWRIAHVQFINFAFWTDEEGWKNYRP